MSGQWAGAGALAVRAGMAGGQGAAHPVPFRCSWRRTAGPMIRAASPSTAARGASPVVRIPSRVPSRCSRSPNATTAGRDARQLSSRGGGPLGIPAHGVADAQDGDDGLQHGVVRAQDLHGLAPHVRGGAKQVDAPRPAIAGGVSDGPDPRHAQRAQAQRARLGGGVEHAPGRTRPTATRRPRRGPAECPTPAPSAHRLRRPGSSRSRAAGVWRR